METKQLSFFPYKRGCINRSQFIGYHCLLIFASLLLLYFLDNALPNLMPGLLIPWAVIMLYFSVILKINRLHDFNASGLLWFCSFIPLANVILILNLLFRRGIEENNYFVGTGSMPESKFSFFPRKCGCVNRSEYFGYNIIAGLFLILLRSLLVLLVIITNKSMPVVFLVSIAITAGNAVFTILFLYVFCILIIQRLHDLNTSGWFWVWILLPLANVLFLLILLLRKGVEKNNRFIRKRKDLSPVRNLREITQ